MNSQNQKPTKKPRDPDLVGAEIALRRAAERVRRRAAETDSAVVVVRNGKVVWEKVETAMDDDLRPEYDLGSLRVHKVGPKRKNFKGQMETEVTTLDAAGRRESDQSRDELEEDGRK